MGPRHVNSIAKQCHRKLSQFLEKYCFISTVTVNFYAFRSTNLVNLSMDLATELIHSKLFLRKRQTL